MNFYFYFVVYVNDDSQWKYGQIDGGLRFSGLGVRLRLLVVSEFDFCLCLISAGRKRSVLVGVIIVRVICDAFKFIAFGCGERGLKGGKEVINFWLKKVVEVVEEVMDAAIDETTLR